MRLSFCYAITRSSSLPPIHLEVLLEPEVRLPLYLSDPLRRDLRTEYQLPYPAQLGAAQRDVFDGEPVEIQVFCELDVGFVVGLG
jgi:hypothetical protein